MRALRGILRHGFGLATQAEPIGIQQVRPRFRTESHFAVKAAASPASTIDGLLLSVVAVPQVTGQSGKQAVIAFAVSELAHPSSPDQDAIIGLCVDADDQPDWRQDIQSSLEASQLTEAKPTPLGWQYAGRELIVVPWTCSRPTIDGLPDFQSIERVAVHAAAEVEPAFAPIIVRWLEELKAKDPKLCIWKAAALLWQAATHPKDSFFDKVFDQNKTLVEASLKLLRAEPAWPALQRLCTP